MAKEQNLTAEQVIDMASHYMNQEHLALVKKRMNLRAILIKSNFVNQVSRILFINSSCRHFSRIKNGSIDRCIWIFT